MKKIVIGIFISLMLLMGCANEEKSSEKWRMVEEKELPAPEQPAEPEPAPEPEAVMLGSAQTTILDFQESRIHNIKLCIQKINGYTLAPGKSFSFNNVVGPRTADQGYQKATVLMHGEKTQDFGGGVCQASTTLYQAARAAGLTVTERHSHQKDVGYAHPGDDAAVDYGNKDMCFINNKSTSIVIEAAVGNGVVSASVRQAK